MSRLEKLLEKLTKEEIAEREQFIRSYSFSDILVNRVYQNFSGHKMDTCYREISMASMKVLILRLFDISGHLSDFNFQEMCSFFMMPVLKNEKEVEEELSYIFYPNRESNLSNLSTEELVEIVLDFARYMGLELFYTCLKELCLCTKKPIAQATYTYFILNEENFIKFVKCLYRENHGDYSGDILRQYLNLDLIKYHHEHQ
jgi:hypothetical protein